MSFDILVIPITIFFVIRGWIKGFIEEALNLIFIILTIYFSLKFYGFVTTFIEKITGKFFINKLAGFIILVIFFSLISIIIKEYLVEPLKKIKVFRLFDKILGVCMGILISTLITFGISYFIMFFLDPSILQQSKVFPYYEKIFKFLLHLFRNEAI